MFSNIKNPFVSLARMTAVSNPIPGMVTIFWIFFSSGVSFFTIFSMVFLSFCMLFSKKEIWDSFSFFISGDLLWAYFIAWSWFLARWSSFFMERSSLQRSLRFLKFSDIGSHRSTLLSIPYRAMIRESTLSVLVLMLRLLK